MKSLYSVEKTKEDANRTVKGLMSEGISAYRQGLSVYVDDGGIDDGDYYGSDRYLEDGYEAGYVEC